MTDYIDRCLDEGLMPLSEYFDLIEAGDDDFASEPEVCVHEAGHAVMAYVVGRPIEYVSACEWDEDAIVGETPDRGITYMGSPGGVVRYTDEPVLTGPELAARLYRDVVTAASGPLAQHIYTGEAIEHIMDPANDDPNRSSDWHLINNDWICRYGDIMFAEPPFKMPEEWSDDDYERFYEWQGKQLAEVERKLWVDAERILQENWDLVSGLAAVLMSNPWLDGPQVYDIFERIQARRTSSN
jgi:hypothetical protein